MGNRAMRILGLDVGTKRIGIAISDPMGIIASPRPAISRNPEDKAIDNIKELCQNYEAKTIVIGLPKHMNGTIGIQAEDCINFAKNFEDEYEIVFEDERLTSRQAEINLATVGKKYTKNKGLVDTESACIILQQYLDRK
jgi:putative Holliday junction resolvase